MNFYVISSKTEPTDRIFNIFRKDIIFSEFIKNIENSAITVCHFSKDFKYISGLIVRRPEIIKLLILTKTITKQLKSKLSSMSSGNYLLKIIVVTKTKTTNINNVFNGIVDREGLLEKNYLILKNKHQIP